MNHDKVDDLLMKAGVRFEFLHGIDYENFCPYDFVELIVRECIQAIDDIGGYNEEFHMNVIKNHFGVE